MKSTDAVPRTGRNERCPCGSGRKFKLCCGAAASRKAAANAGSPPATIVPEPAPLSADSNGKDSRLAVGQLTGIERIQEVTERPRQIQFGLSGNMLVANRPSSANRGATPRPDVVMAEWHRQRGIRLLSAEKYAAARSALRQATELDPGDAISQHALGRALMHSGHLVEAADALRVAVTLNDNFAAAYCDLAVALDELGRDREAVAACRRAIALESRFPYGLHILGELLEAAGETEEAAECFRRVASGAPDTTAGKLDLVRALLLEGKIVEAEAQLRHAIALDPDSDELPKVLGEVLAKQGRFPEAVEACDRALSRNRLQVPAHLTAVRVKKCTAADRPRLACMLATLRDPAITDAHRLFLHFAAGKLLDDLGDFREAMRHFDLANGIRGQNSRFDRAAFEEVIDRLIGRFTSDFFAANAAFGLEDEMPLLIVGMPRSGTTLVEQIVSRHPAITAGEELFFWFGRNSVTRNCVGDFAQTRIRTPPCQGIPDAVASARTVRRPCD